VRTHRAPQHLALRRLNRDNYPLQTPSRSATIAAVALYFLGVVWLGAMAFAAAWPDMEASVFDSGTALAASASLPELRCPWVITTGENAVVRARFTKAADRPDAFLVRANISAGYTSFPRRDTQQVRLEPRESRELAWPVTAEDAAFGRLVLVRVLANRGLVTPARQSPCGILVLNLPGASGQWLFILGGLIGLALTGAGAAWWWLRRRPLGEADSAAARATGLVAVIVLASLITGMAGEWLVSHLLLVGAILYFFVWLEPLA
jgi:hypothetical protein